MNRSNIELIHGDCMDALRNMKDNEFDLAIVDPPYGISVNKMTLGSGKYKNTGKEWDSETPTQEYFDQLKRVSKNRIIWGANYMIDKIKDPSMGWIYWDKENGDSDFSDGELAFSSFDRALRSFKHHLSKDRSKRFHPTQKPVKLYEWLLTNYATCKTCNNEGGYYEDVAGDGGSRMWIGCDDCYNEHTENNGFRILDTHLGSGSIAIACHNLKFDLVGYELDEDYYNAAVKRFEQHKKQLQLF